MFGWLIDTMPRCPNLKYVVLEQLGSGLTTDSDRRLFGNDFTKMDRLVQQENQKSATCQSDPFGRLTSWRPDSTPIADAGLQAQQQELSIILETAIDYVQANQMLLTSTLANSAWDIEKWEPSMLETAINIAQKWQHGFD